MNSAQSAPAVVALIAEGHAHFRNGRLREAEQSYRRALALDPGQPEALAFLGMMAGQAGRLQVAVEMFERALKRAPRNADIHHNLGETWRHIGDNAKALQCFERATACNPNHIEAYRSGADAALALAKHCEAAGRWQEAAHYKQLATRLLIAAGQRLLIEVGDQVGAAEILQRATQIAPKSAEAWSWYGRSLVKPFPTKAAAALRRSIELDPHIAWVHGSLSDALALLRRDEDARSAWSAAAAVDPAYHDTRKLLSACELLSLYEVCAKDEAFALHRAWGKAVARHRMSEQPPFKNDCDPARRLRIGYVSADYRNHSVAYFLEPLLAAHDRSGFEIACYSATPAAREDQVTARFKTLTALWRNVSTMDSDAFCKQVRSDSVDILIDLSGHFEGSKLVAFAAKPAPVTATWLGYPATTGLANMDWRITDAIVDPPGEEAFHTEKLMRLDSGFLCYRPPANAPEITLPPALANGHVTFGSFNNQMKINSTVIEAWSRLLKSVPDARLLIKSELLEDEGVVARLQDGFAANGVDLGRLEFRTWQAANRDHLMAYADVDIALDPFPYNGTTTTCEALWMGVPIIALIGDRHSARVGFDLLRRVGLERFAAPDIESYVRIAAALANDHAALAELRAGLRERVAHSPLCDATRFARAFESALRAAWRQWCESAGCSGVE